MTIDRSTLAFFDASCLIAATGSPQGGSGFLMSLCARGLLNGAVSHVVLLEAEHNIAAKMGPRALERFHQLLMDVPLALASLPAIPPEAAWQQYVNAKDAHVVAASLAIEAPYLLTLDQGLIVQVTNASLPIQALTPGDFIRGVLPHHLDYPNLRA